MWQKVKPVKRPVVLLQIPVYVDQATVLLSSSPSGLLPVISCTCHTPLHFITSPAHSQFILELITLDIKCFSWLLTPPFVYSKEQQGGVFFLRRI